MAFHSLKSPGRAWAAIRRILWYVKVSMAKLMRLTVSTVDLLLLVLLADLALVLDFRAITKSLV